MVDRMYKLIEKSIESGSKIDPLLVILGKKNQEEWLKFNHRKTIEILEEKNEKFKGEIEGNF